MTSLIQLASRECYVPEQWVENVLRLGPSRVKKLKIPKRNSINKRVVSRPSAELEILQRWLTIKFFNKIPLHNCAAAFRPDYSILNNAEKHINSNYFIRIDFSNFFPSITFKDFIRSLTKHSPDRILTDNTDSLRFIRRVCFDKSERLPIGYISSPAISNIVMIDFDTDLSNIVINNVNSLGNGVLTRYADDINFSTNFKGGCTEFLKLTKDLVQQTTSPNLEINENKTSFTSKSGGSAVVTGLRICNDGHITVNRKYKDKIRLMLSLHAKGALKDDDIQVLRGHISYIRHTAPTFFSNIYVKHINTIDKLVNYR